MKFLGSLCAIGLMFWWLAHEESLRRMERHLRWYEEWRSNAGL